MTRIKAIKVLATLTAVVLTAHLVTSCGPKSSAAMLQAIERYEAMKLRCPCSPELGEDD